MSVSPVLLQRIGGLLGAVGVAMGAYGAHGLPVRLKKLEWADAEIEASALRRPPSSLPR